ncbi:MAG: ArgR family transcriptional regulator [Eggerthellales bacterium]|nr:ArgR family transcriptional regulator [Eggerthellales bacterium]
MSKLDDRRDAIRTLVRNESIRTQRELADRLRELGYDCTQATISRDITELRLEKPAGSCYMLPEDMRFQRIIHELVTSAVAAMNIVVVKTMSGSANAVAEVLDTSKFEGLLGTVAGDNTIMIVTDDPEHAQNLTDKLNSLIA